MPDVLVFCNLHTSDHILPAKHIKHSASVGLLITTAAQIF